jgi:hypothetical protein
MGHFSMEKSVPAGSTLSGNQQAVLFELAHRQPSYSIREQTTLKHICFPAQALGAVPDSATLFNHSPAYREETIAGIALQICDGEGVPRPIDSTG